MKHFGIRSTEDASSEKDSNTMLNSDSNSVNRIAPSNADGGVVMVTIGGGHYVPKMNDAVRTTNIPHKHSYQIFLPNIPTKYFNK